LRALRPPPIDFSGDHFRGGDQGYVETPRAPRWTVGRRTLRLDPAIGKLRGGSVNLAPRPAAAPGTRARGPAATIAARLPTARLIPPSNVSVAHRRTRPLESAACVDRLFPPATHQLVFRRSQLAMQAADRDHGCSAQRGRGCRPVKQLLICSFGGALASGLWPHTAALGTASRRRWGRNNIGLSAPRHGFPDSGGRPYSILLDRKRQTFCSRRSPDWPTRVSMASDDPRRWSFNELSRAASL